MLNLRAKLDQINQSVVCCQLIKAVDPMQQIATSRRPCTDLTLKQRSIVLLRLSYVTWLQILWQISWEKGYQD